MYKSLDYKRFVLLPETSDHQILRIFSLLSLLFYFLQFVFLYCTLFVITELANNFILIAFV